MTVDPRALLVGAVDTHVHSAPDLVPRKLDDVEVARQARDAGMAAGVRKNPFLRTPLRAGLDQALLPRTPGIGAARVNHTKGGGKPGALEPPAGSGAQVR